MATSNGSQTHNSRTESLAVAHRLLHIEADAVKALESRVDEAFSRALDLLISVTGRVIVTGMGKSGHIGRKISATLASTGTPSAFLHPTEAAHGDLGMVTRQDGVIVISKSGATAEILNLIPYFKLLSVPVIGLLGNCSSPIGEKCDTCLDVSVVEEGCPLDLAPTASTTATLAMGDALAVALLTEKKFRPEDFAFLHPGGALGRRLNLRVEEIMHTGAEIPAVPPGASMKEVIVEMTRKRLGAACVVNNAGCLEGIFTDGDLRRAFERGENFSSATASHVAIRQPKAVEPATLVTRAINIMETYNIFVLPVLDADKKLVGIVHMHDLLKSGIGR
ncbi:KpsF/GutQ family sugar-phosphate isomerase [candidate division KSB1 bacterium]|nr:MAG: KpsF/GutQ family sugar-phosphate isomerase [candidate division KSB1 bacterium]